MSLSFVHFSVLKAKAAKTKGATSRIIRAQDIVSPVTSSGHISHTVTLSQIEFKRDNHPNMVVLLKALSPQINVTKI